MQKTFKREAPNQVAPVVVNGMRIEVVQYGIDLGVEQNGGYIVAYDENTNTRLWVLKVYDTQYDKGRELDVQDVFIFGITISKKGLKIIDEMNRHFLVDIDNKTVTRLS